MMSEGNKKPGRPRKSQLAAVSDGTFPEGGADAPAAAPAVVVDVTETQSQAPAATNDAPARDAAAPLGYMLQPKVAGYRFLNDREAERINVIKATAREVRELCEDVERWGGDADDLRVARDLLRTGFSALVRAVAKPTQW